MRALRYILFWLVALILWLAVVILFYLYGWSGDEPYSGYTHDGPFYTNLRFEEAVGYAAIGVGAATCVVTGLILIYGVRARGLNRGLAASLLVASSVVSTILPVIVVSVIMRSTQYGGGADTTGIHLFQGESAMWLAVASVLAFRIVLCASIVFLVCIFKVAKSKKTLQMTTVAPGN